MTATVHANTPQLSVIDSRGLAVRHVAYCRRENTGVIPQARITRQQHDAVGHLRMLRDPRFQAPDARPNMTTIYGLSGGTLITDSIDAGWRLRLYGEAGTAQEAWDGRGSHWRHEHDDQQRPVATHEQAKGSIPRTIERLTYANNSVDFAERNQCGQSIRHDHSAGVVWFKQRGLNGGSLRELQRFLPDLADVQADWPDLEADRDQLLQPGTGYTTQRHYGPTGEVLVQTDAGGHRQHFSVDRAGQLQRIDLTLAQQTLQPLLKAASYNAEGQLLEQVTGNDVVNTATYEPSTCRLQRLIATSADRQLQSLSYEYDPVGNIVQLVDHTQPDTFFSNQRVAALNSYTYDSLYQLVCATGRETAGAGQTPGLPELIVPSPIDPGRLLNYSEYYEYDAGGNRTELRHISDTNPFRHLMRVDPISNRALPWSEGEEQPDFERNFDANGNLRYLLPGTQPMNWDARNQLQSVTTVRRTTGTDDGEWYRYNAAGERVVKFSIHHARTVTHKRVVHYLPGLEVRTGDNGEELQVIVIALARGNVRCLHWAKSKPKEIEDDPLRYSVDDHLGSCSLELDQHANVISHEGYYPYGGTAWWAARSAVDADYKTIRYSGKEQDASGLYYYGFRYLAPWLGRWVNPDPAGNIDGLNLYRMVGNNPILYTDALGKDKTPINKDIHMIWIGESPEKLAAQVANINNTVNQASGYKVHLYIETATKDSFSKVLRQLKVHDITYLRESALFSEFQQTEVSTLYNDFRLGDAKNLAYAADVLKPFIVFKLGGMYSDVDDAYQSKHTEDQQKLGNFSLMAEPAEVVTHEPVSVPWEWAGATQLPNSSFAAHAGSQILKDLMDEMTLRYQKLVASGTYSTNGGYIGQAILDKNPNGRLKIMADIVGPRVLTDVIKRHDSDAATIIDQATCRRFNGFGPADLDKRMEAKMPLGRYINLGNLNSWK